jgi:hypothetical protein
MSILIPVGATIAMWLLDTYLMDLRSPEVTGSSLLIITSATCLMLWWVLSVAVLAENPGYGKYAFYIIILPVWTIIVNCFLDNSFRLELFAVGAVVALTWFGSLIVCAIDWYKFNHQPFELKN